MPFVVSGNIHAVYLLAHGHDAAFGISAGDADELFGARVGKRNQENSVHETEDGGVGADAEGESENRDRGKAGRLAEHAESEAKVLEQCFEEGKAAGTAVLLFGLLPAAEAEVRLAASFGGGEAARSEERRVGEGWGGGGGGGEDG